MKKEGYYSSGQFAKMAHVSVRTIRFYDQKHLLKPSYVSESGARFYTDYDFVKLQQILLLKYLGFSLDDIREMSTGQQDHYFLKNALTMQKKLIEQRQEEMEQVKGALDATLRELEGNEEPDWKSMLELIHLTAMESSLKKQYQNANNISARIHLHEKYSVNQQSWFSWLYEKCEVQSGMKILEIGCGNGALWVENMADMIERGVTQIQLVLSDISSGILGDARRNMEELLEARYGKTAYEGIDLNYCVFDCAQIPFERDTFDLVIANHVMFYCQDVEGVCKEIARVLKPKGRFICSTYSKEHMKEIRQLVQEFDHRILLSAEHLYDKFGLENGAEILQRTFKNVQMERYVDEILLDDADPLIAYILSCHGNQNQYLLDRYNDFRSYIVKKVGKQFRITKDAGIFCAERE